jgi:hypothetical protein
MPSLVEHLLERLQRASEERQRQHEAIMRELVETKITPMDREWIVRKNRDKEIKD